MLTFFTLASASGTDILTHVTTLFTDSWVLIALAIGIPVGFYVIRALIALMPKSRGSRRGRD